MTDVEQRMAELISLIDNRIIMTDSPEELLMLACAMLQRTTEIFEQVLGPQGRKEMFKGLDE